MARLSRTVAAGFPHHVVQRGNYDQPVFGIAADYQRYLEWLGEYSARFNVEIWAYCLMPNHVHFVCVPKTEDSLARAFNTLHMRYAQYFNGKQAVCGHLWRARFMSCALDSQSVHEVVRFIETNPVRKGYVESAEDYPWSSARSHVTGVPDPCLSDGRFFENALSDWRAYLAGRGEDLVIQRVRDRLKTGRPAGDVTFVRELEGILGRCLEARPRGRPRKSLGIKQGG